MEVFGFLSTVNDSLFLIGILSKMQMIRHMEHIYLHLNEKVLKYILCITFFKFQSISENLV